MVNVYHLLKKDHVFDNPQYAKILKYLLKKSWKIPKGKSET